MTFSTGRYIPLNRKELLKKIQQLQQTPQKQWTPKITEQLKELEHQWDKLPPPEPEPATAYLPAEYEQVGQFILPAEPSTPVKQPRRGAKQFRCKDCGATFDYPYELATHVRLEKRRRRIEEQGRYQLDRIPAQIPKNYKDLKIQRKGVSPLISAGFFIPRDWQYIRIHKAEMGKRGIWVFFERMP